MLRLLGAAFYLFAALGGLAALISLFSESGWFAMIGFASAISSAFFGSMCFAAEEAIRLLKRIAGVTYSDEADTALDRNLKPLIGGLIVIIGLVIIVVLF